MSNEIRHHLTDEILMAYSAGSLNEAFSLMVASHVSLCDECRARLASFDAIGGALLDEAPTDTAALAPDSLQATMARIAAGPAQPARPRRRPGVLPAPLQDYVNGDVDKIRWRAVGMGVKQAILKTAPGATARLLYIPAGGHA